jgi:tetratricopeptide (TPR) repeat protein
MGTLFLAALMSVSMAFSSETSTADLLEKGIYVEETVGDLKSAIKIYTQVIDQVSGQRSHAARALYRKGRCFQKMGDEEQAEVAFRKLVSEYADQADVVSLAKKHLPGCLFATGSEHVARDRAYCEYSSNPDHECISVDQGDHCVYGSAISSGIGLRIPVRAGFGRSVSVFEDV